MAIIDQGLPDIPPPTADEVAEWNEWVAGRPEKMRDMCANLPPWYYYDMPKTGQIVVVLAYSEDRTVRVLVVGDQIRIPAIMQLEVFGVHPEDLVVRRDERPH